MNDIIYSIIDNIDDKGNNLLDSIVLPILKGGKKIIEDNEYIKSISTMRNSFIQNKLSKFLENINKHIDEDIIDFIKNLNTNEKTFLIESINKVIDLDDELQIYILSYLTKKYIKNGNLNYYEKKLYYNVNTLSEDDFQIFFCLYQTSIIKPSRDYIYISSYKNKEIISISLKRFVDLGLLVSSINYDNKNDDISSSESYKKSDYSDELYNCLEFYLKDYNCKEILEKKKNTVQSINLKFF